MKQLLLVSIVLLSFSAAAETTKDKDTGCQVEVQYLIADESTKWTGECVDGKAEGTGSLTSSGGTQLEGQFRGGKPYNATGREPLVQKSGTRSMMGSTYKDGQAFHYPIRKSQEEVQRYALRIRARILPFIEHTSSIEGNPKALVEVRTLPNGKIAEVKLAESSGILSWDQAVVRAVEKAETLPLDEDGTVPPLIQMVFRPK